MVSGKYSVLGQADRPKQAIIVSHGWPSQPACVEADLAWLAAQIEGQANTWSIRSATLAAPQALRLAIERSAIETPLHIFPFFMSDGWFVSEYLRKRVGEIRTDNVFWHKPFGLNRVLPELCCESVKSALADQNLSKMTLIGVAHGSPDNPRPAEIARQLTAQIAKKLSFGDWRCGFVDEAPYLQDVLRIDTPAICLPLFASQAGHVREDLQAAIASSGFSGTLLPIIGVHSGVPKLIAADLERPEQV